MTRGAERLRDEPVNPHFVSVVIPCYNHAHFLGEAIESALVQSYRDFEVIVVDDGSTDDTSEVAAGYPGVRLIWQDNRGLSGARNTGIAASKGDYVVFLDADDRLMPHALERGVGAMRAHPECAFVFGLCRSIATDGTPISPVSPAISKDHYIELLRTNYIWMPAAVMFRREVFRRVGGFDPEVSPSADYDMYLRIAREFPVFCHGSLIAEYRQHDQNMSRNSALMLSMTLRVLRSQRGRGEWDRRCQQAYEEGMANWRNYYGERLVEEVRASVRSRRWRSALKGMLRLLKDYPKGLMVHAGKKFRLTLKRAPSLLAHIFR